MIPLWASWARDVGVSLLGLLTLHWHISRLGRRVTAVEAWAEQHPARCEAWRGNRGAVVNEATEGRAS